MDPNIFINKKLKSVHINFFIIYELCNISEHFKIKLNFILEIYYNITNLQNGAYLKKRIFVKFKKAPIYIYI